MDSGNYGGAFVLTDEHMTEAGVNYIAITTIDTPEKPTLEDFANAYVYLRRSEKFYFEDNELKRKWGDYPEITGYSALTIKYKGFDIEVIGNLIIHREFKPEAESASSWIWLKDLLPKKGEYESINGKPASALKLSKWIKKAPGFPFFR